MPVANRAKKVKLTMVTIKVSLRKVFALALMLFQVSSILYSVACAAVQPELVPQTGHQRPVRCLAFSPDGNVLATGGEDTTVRLWDVSRGLQLRTLSGHPNPVEAMAFSFDGKMVATASGGRVRIWNASSGSLVRAIATDNPNWISVSFTPDNSMIAATAENGTIDLFATNTGARCGRLHLGSNTLYSLACHPKEPILASTDGNGINLWNLSNRNLLKALKGSGEGLSTCLAFSNDGKLLAAGCSNRTIAVWDIHAGSRKTFRYNGRQIYSIAFSPDDHTIVTGGYKTQLYDVSKGCELYGRPSDVTDDISGIKSFSPVAFSSKNMIASVKSKTIVELWDGNTRETKHTLFSRSPAILDLAFSGDGKKIAVAGSDNLIRVLDLERNVVKVLSGHSGWVTNIMFSPDCTRLVSGGNDSRIAIWNVESGTKIKDIVLKKDDPIDKEDPAISWGQIWCLAFSPDGKSLLSAGHNGLQFWNAVTLSEIKGRKFELGEGAVLSDNKTLIASCIEGRLTIVDFRSGKKRFVLGPRVTDSYQASAFSQNGEYLASVYGRVVNIWNTRTGRKISSIDTKSETSRGLSFSKDGRILAIASAGSTVSLFDITNGLKVKTIATGADMVRTVPVSFSPDGTTLVTVQNDSTLNLWNVKCPTKAPISTRKVCTLIFFENDWTVVGPRGQFDTSNLDDIPYLAWVMPDARMNALPVELFFRQYYEPNLLSKVLSGEKLREVPPIDKVNKLQPLVRIVEVSQSTVDPTVADMLVAYKRNLVQTTTQHTLTNAVFDLRLFRDGQLVGYLPLGKSFNSNNELPTAGLDEQTHRFQIKLPCDGKDEYEFTAYAFNSDNVKSNTAKIILRPRIKLEKKRGKAYIIAVGINKYDDPSWNLSFAAEDAREYGKQLVPRLKATGHFSEVIYIPLISDTIDDGMRTLAPTKETLKEILEFLANKSPVSETTVAFLNSKCIPSVQPEDSVVIAFSCHGATNNSNGEFYLFPSNIGAIQNNGLTQELERRGVSSAELTDWLRDVDSTNITMVIDSCHSGAAVGKHYRGGPMNSAGLGQLAYNKRMRILSASSAASTAQERSSLGHGLLTYALLVEGLSADGRADCVLKDGKVFFKELMEFAKKEVPVLDNGMLKKEGVSSMKDVTPIVRKLRHEVQTPSLFDFSKNKEDILIFDVNLKK